MPRVPRRRHRQHLKRLPRLPMLQQAPGEPSQHLDIARPPARLQSPNGKRLLRALHTPWPVNNSFDQTTLPRLTVLTVASQT